MLFGLFGRFFLSTLSATEDKASTSSVVTKDQAQIKLETTATFTDDTDVQETQKGRQRSDSSER